MKKLIYIVPMIIFIFVFTWGFINVNLEVTEAFNNENMEMEQVDYDRLKEDLGMDLTLFTQDKSLVKIYQEEGRYDLVVGNYKMNLNQSLLGKTALKIRDLGDGVASFIREIAM